MTPLPDLTRAFRKRALTRVHALKKTPSFAISATDFASAAPSAVLFVPPAPDQGDPAREFKHPRGTVLHNLRRPSVRRPSFIGTLCEFRLCRGTLLCNSRRPTFPSRFYSCCGGGSVAICSGPRRSSVTRGHCDIGFCHGAVLRKTWVSSFINKRCDCEKTPEMP